MRAAIRRRLKRHREHTLDFVVIDHARAT